MIVEVLENWLFCTSLIRKSDSPLSTLKETITHVL